MNKSDFIENYRSSKELAMQAELSEEAFRERLEQLNAQLLNLNGNETLKADGVTLVEWMGTGIAAKCSIVRDKYIVLLYYSEEEKVLILNGLKTGEVRLSTNDLETAEALFAEVLGIEVARALA